MKLCEEMDCAAKTGYLNVGKNRTDQRDALREIKLLN